MITTALLLGSPGPATIALAATGAGFGFKNGLPFLAGLLSGLIIALTAAATGLALLFEAYPHLRWTMQIAGMTYLLYVAWKIATAPMIASDEETTGAPAYRDGFILNLLNPKAYAAFLALFAQFTLPETAGINGTLLTAMLIFTMVVIVDIIWLGFGGMIRPLFHSPTLHRKIRIGFALLMVASVIWVFFK